MKIENTRLDKINQALHNLERDFDQFKIENKEYLKRHKVLMERKTRIIQKVLDEKEIGDKNE